ERDGFERVAVAHADPEAAPLAARLRRRYPAGPDARRGVARVIRDGEPEAENDVTPETVRDLARDADHLEVLQTLRIRAYATVPLPARGRTLGALTILSTTRPYAEADVAFVAEVARRAAVAVDNARLYRDATSARERLRRQLDFTGALMDSLAEGVVAVDEAGAFTFANAAAEAMLGQPARDLMGTDAHAVLHGACVDACPVGRALHAGATLRDEGTFQARDRGAFPVSLAAAPIVTDGRRIGAVLAFHDTTQRRRAEAELEASRRQLALSEKLSALGTLVSGVAHELRTPLTYVANNLFLLRARLESAARAQPGLEPLLAEVLGFSQAAMEGVDRINALVKDLRPFTQHDSGSRVLAPLEDVVAGAVALFRATQRGHVEVAASLEPTPRIRVDRGQVQRVVINLLSNAAEAMPHGGLIRVSTRACDGAAEITVEDTGPGIPPEVETRIFDPFFTTKPDGTGLGLSISRRIVEMHGGVIGYESRPGQGTRFTVRLPAERPPGRAAEAPAAQP
ncbi:MAG TPA: ATP-binding protein, partial [Candidatus Thermoplasmatota archaeon]|nr:ATP-binding protein [Candidatus Thermoplasmatota archaeon]